MKFYPLRMIYEIFGLRRVLGLEQLFCFADPIAKHPYSIMKEGHYFPWHFNGNEFTVSILI